MPTSEVASKGAQGALFALAGLCFLLPFVSLSCASEEAAEGMQMEQVDQTLTGVQLVIGGSEREGFVPENAIDRPDPEAEPEFTIPAEPFAAIALVAALVGLSLVFIRVTRTRLLGASIAGTAGAASLLLLGLSPTLRALGLNAVTLLYGLDSARDVRSGHGSPSGSATPQPTRSDRRTTRRDSTEITSRSCTLTSAGEDYTEPLFSTSAHEYHSRQGRGRGRCAALGYFAGRVVWSTRRVLRTGRP